MMDGTNLGADSPPPIPMQGGETIENNKRYLFFSLNICCGSPFLLAVTVLVVIVGFPLFGPPRENGRYRFRMDPSRRQL